MWIIVLFSAGLAGGLLAGGFVLSRSRTSAIVDKQATADRAPVETKPDYRAVTIKPGDEPCSAVLELGDQPFLIKSAPLLPLKECNQATCTCSYKHREDRRVEDRRNPFGSHSNNTQLATMGAKNQRKRGRRASDQID
ncbi:MAG: hypothetical protein ACR2QG_13525 [Gammaproteobacteria bacterium]